MPWLVKLAITVAIVWLLASIATFILFLFGDEEGGGELALMMMA